VEIGLWGLVTLPATSTALFYSFVLRARLALGRWPTFSNPDPKDLDFTLHHAAWFGSVVAQLAVAPLLAILCVVGWFLWPSERLKIGVATALYCALLLCSLTLSRWNLGGFSDWMMD
jgi:hypothetical protein